MTTNTRFSSDWSSLVTRLIDKKGWTDQELAGKVGASIGSVRAWRRGASEPSRRYAEKLAALAEGRRVVPVKAAARKGRVPGGPTRRMQAGPGRSAVGRRTDDTERPGDGVQAAILADTMLPENARAALASVRLALLEVVG